MSLLRNAIYLARIDAKVRYHSSFLHRFWAQIASGTPLRCGYPINSILSILFYVNPDLLRTDRLTVNIKIISFSKTPEIPGYNRCRIQKSVI